MKDLILSGELEEGQQLPSIRALASDLRISVITTKRAYAELEAQGFVETVQGKGSFVAGGNAEFLREERLRHIEELLARRRAGSTRSRHRARRAARHAGRAGGGLGSALPVAPCPGHAEAPRPLHLPEAPPNKPTIPPAAPAPRAYRKRQP